MSTPTVFISYSHEDEEWKDRLVTQLGVLQKAGLLAIWEDRKIGAGDDWHQEIEDALNAANIAILMVSANFLTSDFILNEEVPHLLECRQKEGVRIIPLIVKPCAWKSIKWLKPINARPKDGRPLSGGSDYQIDADLTALAEEIEKLVHQTGSTSPTKYEPLPPDEIFTAKLPTTGKDLFGREAELQMLDDAWTDPHMNILSLVAWGGVGKTALVNEWLNRMERDNYRGAERVYGWSFYSQGTREDKQASADTFFEDALAWFGYQGEPLKSPWEKGKELAQLIKQRRTLLILDGLEPLQYPPGEMEGVLRDQGLQTLLKDLARFNHGLCAITTRYAIADLEHFVDKSTKRVLLENLSPQAGRQLLREASVTKGTDNELESASVEYDGHALALNLLGKYIAVRFGGEIRERDKIKQLTYKKDKQGKHARNVMNSYEIWLQGTPELDLLYLMGLFDRPVPLAAIEALKQKPVINGLTDSLQQLSDEDWDFTLQHLRDLRLLAEKDEHRPDIVDCHPLIREHFGEKLKVKNPKARQEAHSRLYDYYKSLPEKLYGKFLPDTLEEMEPLFAAVAHGCQAGRHQEALDGIYWNRILRGSEHFSWKKLGTFGADLAAISNFFSEIWNNIVIDIKDENKAFILGQTGLYLRALGRLREATQPMEATVNLFKKQKKWKNAAIAAGNLSELYLSRGDVPQAIGYARQSVDFADRSGDWVEQFQDRTNLADALYQTGELTQAEELFREAEAMQAKRQPEYRYLYSVQGFQFCDLLLSQGKVREVLELAKQTLEWVTQQNWLLDIALDTHSLGWAYFMQAQAEGKNDYKQAQKYLNAAVAGLREAGMQDYLPRGLFARAFLYRLQKNFPKAWDDLEEVREIAERGSMGIHLADYHLEAGRLCLEDGERKTEDAAGHLDEAKRLFEETGYHRRDPEVLLLEAQVCFATGDKGNAREWLASAKKRFDEMGIRMWDFEVAGLEEKLRWG